MRAVIVDGQTFDTMASACRKYQVSQALVFDRLKRGWSVEDSFKVNPATSTGNPTPVTVETVNYKSIGKAASKYGLCPITVAQRLRVGWSIDQAFELVERDDSWISGKVYYVSNNFNDKYYIGVTTKTLQSRWQSHIHLSASKSHKFAMAIREIGAKNFKIHLLDEADTISELSRLETLYIEKYNTIEDGYNSESGSYNKQFVKNQLYKGKLYTKHELAEKLGIPYTTLLGRIQKGLPLDRSSSIAKSIKFEGKNYPSISALARYLNLQRDTVQYHFKRGNLSKYLDTLEGVL